jgi:hypothetical protein
MAALCGVGIDCGLAHTISPFVWLFLLLFGEMIANEEGPAKPFWALKSCSCRTLSPFPKTASETPIGAPRRSRTFQSQHVRLVSQPIDIRRAKNGGQSRIRTGVVGFPTRTALQAVAYPLCHLAMAGRIVPPLLCPAGSPPEQSAESLLSASRPASCLAWRAPEPKSFSSDLTLGAHFVASPASLSHGRRVW